MQAVDGENLTPLTGAVLFFDGDCILCNGFADFVLRRDRRGVMRLSALQGETAASLLPSTLQHADASGAPAVPRASFTSVILWEDGAVRRKSDAVLRVLSLLGGGWRFLAAVCRVAPRPLRDAVYDLVARNRYTWFGRRAECRLPTEEERGRFLP